MLERLLMAAVLLAVGALLVCAYNCILKRRASANAPTDPLLRNLREGAAAIVYFTVPGCVPCRTQQQPTLERLSHELGDRLQIVRVDAAEDQAAAERWGVLSAPTTFVLDPTRRVHHVNHGLADVATLRRQLETAGGIT